ncbi:MAG: ATP-grasp domain-containing protein [Xanthomonadaceae bacterium]|jgi:hypothetical protein|nr:ATP-grasp domain-containing protein [Xanthomonadaceae bacterium]
MRLLYPQDPTDRKAPDEAYRDEYEAVTARGLACWLLSLEDLPAGTFRPRPALCEGEATLYRGWMLTPVEYQELARRISAHGATPLTSPEANERCHYLPRWYAQCRDLTPETIFLPKDADFRHELRAVDWPGYFVKDYVKSLTTSRGSIARTPAEVAEIVGLIEHYRGRIEGGVCVRRLEDLMPETEERYFVVGGEPHARDGAVPDLVRDIARRIESPFFTVDVCAARDGRLRLVELGDGQVSDRKRWDVTRFAELLAAAGVASGAVSSQVIP